MRQPISELDPVRLIELLHHHSVDYVVVGGYAGLLHGATRPTIDLDVVPGWNKDNLERLCVALRSIDARSITGPECDGNAIAGRANRTRDHELGYQTWPHRHDGRHPRQRRDGRHL